MRLIGIKKLEKYKRKNIGNTQLSQAISEIIYDIECASWRNEEELKDTRADADCVHNDGFYFFNITSCRVLILLEFEEGEATVIWIGSHSQYERTFRNNKRTIRNWLKVHEYID